MQRHFAGGDRRGVAMAGTGLPAFADAVSDGLAKAKDNLAAYTAKPVFKAPGAAFDAKACAAGKKRCRSPTTAATPSLRASSTAKRPSAQRSASQVTEGQNQGNPSEWVQQVELATRDKYDIIDLISGIDPASIEPSLQAAKARASRS